MPPATVLIVDDNPENLSVLGEVLQPHYQVRAANGGARALQLARLRPLPELILLDVMMPVMDGHEVLRRLRGDPLTAAIPVIFVTALSGDTDEQAGFDLGAVDYIAKPLRPPVVLARVRTHIELSRARRELQRHNRLLAAEVAERMRETLDIQDMTIRALARLAEVRDHETGHHILRTQRYVEHLARLASRLPQYQAQLDDETIVLMAKSAPLHDIGKVGIPDHILLKPAALTPEEWTVMKTHARLGADAIERAQADALRPLPFLDFARQIARSHHERWDGRGYPDGLKGWAIPLAARLMAIADVFDAMLSRRVYKDAVPAAEVKVWMAQQRGGHFDPELLDLFLAHFDEFCAIAHALPDDGEPEQGASARAAAMVQP